MRKAIIFIVVAFLLTFCVAPVYANDIPPRPHAFCGTVEINGDPAPENTTVEARGNGVIAGTEDNPITVTEEGKFGSPEPLGQKLIVKGDIANGTKISFLVNGTYTGTTLDFEEGKTTVLELNLVITDESITGEVEKIIPSNQTDYEVDASDVADTTVTVNTTGVVTITVQKYADNPHPEAPLPANMVKKYIDIDIDVLGLGNIDWPMRVEQTYTNAEIAGLNEDTLKMYYFKNDAWHQCSDTDVDTTDIVGPPAYSGYIWAKMTQDELTGSPIAFGGAAAPAAPEAWPGGGGGGPAPTPAGTTDIRGKASTAGRFWYSVTAMSEDELCTLTIPRGTVGLTEELETLTEITMLIMDEPPAPPEDAHVVGLAYDFGPDGATFDPAITLTWSYDPADIPEGVAEEDLVIACYDEAAGEWVELEGCVVDTENDTITASVSHLTTFAIIGTVTPPPPSALAAFSVTDLSIQPAEVEPKETVTIRLSVANTGGTEGSYSVVLKIDGVKEAEKSVTITAGSSEDVSFSVTREEVASYSVTVDGLSASFVVVAAPPPPPVPVPAPAPPPAKLINWPVVSGIIAGVAIVIVLIIFLVRRRAY